MAEVKLGNRLITYDVIRKPIKHAYIRVKEKDSLMITCGQHFSEQALVNLICRHQTKLIRMLDSIRANPIYDPHQIRFFGKEYALEERLGSHSDIWIETDRMVICGKRKDLRLRRLEKFYQQEVIQAATEMLADLNDTLGREIRLTAITLKCQRMRSQLGSCIPSRRIIKLNSVLGEVDLRYCRAILIHELIHLQIGGHQNDFYQMMERYLPNYRRLRKELMDYLRNM
jgi:hypothetical protein